MKSDMWWNTPEERKKEIMRLAKFTLGEKWKRSSKKFTTSSCVFCRTFNECYKCPLYKDVICNIIEKISAKYMEPSFTMVSELTNDDYKSIIRHINRLAETGEILPREGYE